MAKVLGIDFKRDADALLLGGAIALVLSVLPIPGDPIGTLLAKVRKMFGGV